MARLGAGMMVAMAMMLMGGATAWADSPVGVWKTIDDETGQAKSHVQIWESGGKYFGKIVKLLQNPDAKCDKCKGDKKDQPVLGMQIIWNMEKDDDEYSGGKILDPKNGKTYRCKFWLEGGKLKVRGYVFLFYRTQTWHRVE